MAVLATRGKRGAQPTHLPRLLWGAVQHWPTALREIVVSRGRYILGWFVMLQDREDGTRDPEREVGFRVREGWEAGERVAFAT